LDTGDHKNMRANRLIITTDNLKRRLNLPDHCSILSIDRHKETLDFMVVVESVDCDEKPKGSHLLNKEI